MQTAVADLRRVIEGERATTDRAAGKAADSASASGVASAAAAKPSHSGRHAAPRPLPQIA
jgi:hypothetical protein